jgi:trehalose 6-phosphate phosphatase
MVDAQTATSFSLPMGGPPWALFIDLDGTLLDICPRPGQVFATYEVIKLLPALQRTFDGAIALLSGRTIDDIDRILYPLQLPCAGIHGAERRSTSGRTMRLHVDADRLRAARESVSPLAGHPGVEIEDKEMCFAIHTRAARELHEEVDRAVTDLANTSDGLFRKQEGKHVVEFVPSQANKGRAILEFLEESPFASRTPLVFGDDATDAAAFDAAVSRGGVSIRVGNDAPPAAHTVTSPRACRRLLAELVALGDSGLIL